MGERPTLPSRPNSYIYYPQMKMAGPETDIAAAEPRYSMGEELPYQHNGKLVEQLLPVHQHDSEDAMSDETLQNEEICEIRSMVSAWQKALKNFAISLLPSPISRLYGYNVEAGSRSHGPTSYLDGIRGVASFCVFLEHASNRFHPEMFEEYGNHPYFWQLPIIRLAYSGSVMVAIFFVVSGFSLALRPMEMIYERDWERLQQCLSSATIRRAIRIVLPPAFATFVVMLGVRLHLFDLDEEGPAYRETFLLQFGDWIEYVATQLIYPHKWGIPLKDVTSSMYAAPLWTISKELWGSFLLFITLTGVARVQSAARVVFGVFLVYYAAWCMREDLACFLCGMLIAEHHVYRARLNGVSKSVGGKTLSTIGWSFLLFIGLWLSSIPHRHGSYGSYTPGFRLIATIVPWQPHVFTTGAILTVWAISNLPFIQVFFNSAVPRYLGQISFGLYLVHWPILAAWGWRVPPAIWKITGNDTSFQHALGFGIALVFIIPVCLCVADVFWRVVDLRCIRLAKRVETSVMVDI